MHNYDWSYTLRFQCAALAFGTVLAVLMIAAIILAAYNMPEPNAGSDDAVQIAWGALIILASLLATAPLLHWWYDAIRRLFRIS